MTRVNINFNYRHTKTIINILHKYKKVIHCTRQLAFAISTNDLKHNKVVFYINITYKL